VALSREPSAATAACHWILACCGAHSTASPAGGGQCLSGHQAHRGAQQRNERRHCNYLRMRMKMIKGRVRASIPHEARIAATLAGTRRRLGGRPSTPASTLAGPPPTRRQWVCVVGVGRGAGGGSAGHP
jgi:hypothetical protein